MMAESRKEGAAETLRGVVVIVIVGALLGVSFNALGLASHPPRGLSWITKKEKMPSLEELQPTPPAGEQPGQAPAGGPASSLAPRATPAARSGSMLVLAVSLPPQTRVVLASGTDSAAARPAKPAKKAATAKAKAKKSAAKAVPPGPAAAKPAAPAPAPAGTPATATADLPVVPDLQQPISVKLPFVKKFFDAGAAVFVDARDASEYVEGHIPGAQSVPVNDAVTKPALLDPFKTAGKPIIAYCSGGDCEESEDLAKDMIAAGIHKVLVFTDGFPAWKAAGYPVETGAGR